MDKQLKKWLKSLKLNESTISMILGGLVVVVVGVLIYNYFTSVGKQTGQPLSGDQQLAQELTPKGLPTTHTVATGEDLWKIAEKYYNNGYNWADIAKANKLANPNRLLVGQTLTIPQIEKPTEAKVTPAAAISGTSYTVIKGDTLWNIAVKAYQDGYKWPEIVKANADKIANPDIIEVGLVLTLPR